MTANWFKRNKKPLLITGSVLVLGTITIIAIKHAKNKPVTTTMVTPTGTTTVSTPKPLTTAKKKKIAKKIIENYRA